MTDKTEVTEIPINKIRPAPWQPRETFEKEKIAALGESLKEKGIIQPIVVRKNKTGDGYQIIAGERRWRAWEFTGKKTIPAVIKDVDDLTAKELSIIENLHREDLNDIEKEKFIFDLWSDGMKAGKYASVADMGRKTSMPEGVLRNLLNGYKDRNSLKIPMDSRDRLASDDFTVTRALQETSPEARKELLAIRADKSKDKYGDVRSEKIMPQREMRKVVQTIKEAEPEHQAAVAKMIREEKVEPKNLEKFVKVLKEAAPDIQKKMLKSEITPDEAEAVKIFKTPEQRAQVLEERKILVEGYKDADERHVAVRKRMADDVEAGKKPTIASPTFDFREPNEQRDYEATLRKYQNLTLDMRIFRADHILSMKDKVTRDACIACVKQVVDHCNSILIKVDEMKVITESYSPAKKTRA